MSNHSGWIRGRSLQRWGSTKQLRVVCRFAVFALMSLDFASQRSHAWTYHASSHPQHSSSRRSLLFGTVAVPALLKEDVASARTESASPARTCESTVAHFSGELGDIFLVGVAHVSNKSTELVQQAIRVAGPDLVMVELDSGRMGVEAPSNSPVLGPQSQAQQPVPSEAIRQSQAQQPTSLRPGQLMLVEPKLQSDADAASATSAKSRSPPPAPAPWELAFGAVADAARNLAVGALRVALDGMYKQMESYLDVSAGSEMVMALKESAKAGVPVLLGDQPASTTLRRLTEEAGSVDFNELELQLTSAVPELQLDMDNPKVLQQVLEGYRDQSTTRRLRRGFKLGAPGLFRALIDERDSYMARNLLEGLRAGRKRIVAVVGSIHVEGIGERLAERGGLRSVDSCLYAQT